MKKLFVAAESKNPLKSRMKTLALIMLALTQTFGTNSVARADDNIDGSRYSVKRVPQKNGNLAFLLCDMNKVPEACEYIGRRAGYSSAELLEIKKSELTGARWKTGGAVVAGIVVGFIGVELGAVIAIGSGGAGTAGNVGIVVLGSAGASTPLWFDKVNPFHQYAQAEVLDEKGLADASVVVKSDDEVLDIADLLKEILPE